MEKDLNFNHAWVCALLTDIRDELKAKGTLKAGRKDDMGLSLLDTIEAVLDSVGAIEVLAESRAQHKLEYLKWYQERGRFVFPDMKKPEGWKP